MNLLPLLLLVGLYVAFVMPQRRRAKARDAEIASLVTGDRVLLTSGVHGIVIEVKGSVLVVQVAPGTPLHVVRQGIMRRVTETEPGIPSHDDLGVDVEDADVEVSEASPELSPASARDDATRGDAG
jgi:preprotein translocase subunit YajC